MRAPCREVGHRETGTLDGCRRLAKSDVKASRQSRHTGPLNIRDARQRTPTCQAATTVDEAAAEVLQENVVLFIVCPLLKPNTPTPNSNIKVRILRAQKSRVRRRTKRKRKGLGKRNWRQM